MRAIRISVLCLTLAGSTGACARSQPEPGSQAADTQAQTAVVSDSILPDSIVEITWEWVGFSTPVEQITATIWFMRDGDLYFDLPMDSGTLRLQRQA